MLLFVTLIFVACLVGVCISSAIDRAFALSMTPRQKRAFAVLIAVLCWPYLIAVQLGELVGDLIEDWASS